MNAAPPCAPPPTLPRGSTHTREQDVHSPAFWWTRKAPEPVSRAGFRMPGGVPVQQGTWCAPRRAPPRSTRPAGVASAERRCARTILQSFLNLFDTPHWGPLSSFPYGTFSLSIFKKFLNLEDGSSIF